MKRDNLLVIFVLFLLLFFVLLVHVSSAASTSINIVLDMCALCVHSVLVDSIHKSDIVISCVYVTYNGTIRLIKSIFW